MRGRAVAAAGWTVTTALATGALALTGTHHTTPTDQPRMHAGSAWLPSNKTGQLALLDGTTGEITAQIKVAPEGHNLTAVQDGTNAYAIDTTQGTIRRINGNTLTTTPGPTDTTPPATPIPAATTGLRAYPTPTTLYTIDTEHGILARADPRTLTRQGNLQPLAADTTPQTTTIDSRGTLRVLDPKTGILNIITPSHRTTRRNAKPPGPGQLLLAADQPVILDPARHNATVLDRGTGEPTHAIPLEMRDGDELATAGSPDHARFYLLTRGTLTICQLTAATCDRAIPLGEPHHLGTPTETADHLFIPDYTTGKVTIVDLTTNTVTAQPQVTDPPADFQLLTHDGIIFYNSPDTEQAGIIHLDGGILKTPKYDAEHPSPDRSKQPETATPSPSASPSTTPSPTTSPTATPHTTPSPGTSPSTLPSPNPTTPAGTPSISGGPSPSPTVQRRATITLTTTGPSPGETVQLTVQAGDGGSAPQTATWSLGDGTTAKGLSAAHAWSQNGTYQVTVTAGFPDGQSATASATITVSPPTLTVLVTGPGRVTGPGINCGTDCQEPITPGQTITLSALPDLYVTFQWQGCTPVGSNTCTLAPSRSQTVSVAFHADQTPPDVTLTGSGQTSGGTNRQATVDSTSRQDQRLGFISGVPTSLMLTETSKDQESQVTRAWIHASGTYTCKTGGQQTRSDYVFNTGAGSALTVVWDPSTLCASGDQLTSVRYYFTATAVSSGGTSPRTGTLEFDWSYIG
nr:PKD domain-containing protein [Streptomyces sp. TLI_235]